MGTATLLESEDGGAMKSTGQSCLHRFGLLHAFSFSIFFFLCVMN